MRRASIHHIPSDMGAAQLPVFSIDQIAGYLTRGYWKDQGEDTRHWAAKNDTLTFDVSGLSAGRAELARLAFAAWSDVVDLEFVEVVGSAEIMFTDANPNTANEYDNGQQNGGTITQATINIGANFTGGDAVDSYAYQVFVHEIGHALGLGHAGNYNDSAHYENDAEYRNDTWQATVMSYFGQGNFGGNFTRYVMTPQMADIRAATGIYGASRVRTGDTVYGFDPEGHSGLSAQIYDFDNFTQAPAFTIVDSGGVDELDCSRYNAAQRIDLKGGAWSDVGGLKGNIGIYISTVIENAAGGAGADVLLGNAAANFLVGNGGADRLNGRGGRDRLSGGEADDRFIFQDGSGRDRITDFVSGLDKVDLKDFDFASFRAVKSRIDFDANGAVVDCGGGDRLTIDLYARDDLSAGDFLI